MFDSLLSPGCQRCRGNRSFISVMYCTLLLQAICETYWQKNYFGDISTMSRRCRARSDCRPGSFSECCGACYFDQNQMENICYKCNYGVEDVSYKCDVYCK